MKKLLAILTCIYLLAGCAGTGTRETHPRTAGVQKQAQEQEQGNAVDGFAYGKQFLEGQERELYDQLWRAAVQYDLSVAVPAPASLSEEGLERVGRYLRGDYPALYWARPVLESRPDGGRLVRLETGDGLGLAEIRQRQSAIEQAAYAMLDGVGGDHVDIVAAVHDRMVQRLNYDGGNRREDNTNIYGGLVRRYAVCDGYAQTFQYLMQLAGIDCAYFTGQSTRGLPHAWNAVRIDGEWAYVDVTWDATDPWRRDTYHYYLGMTLEETQRAHRFDLGQYPDGPPQAGGGWDYYRHYGYAVAPGPGLEVEQLAQAFANQLERAALPDEPGAVFLEVKVDAGQEEYERIRALYIKEVFAVLGRLKELAEERGLPVEIQAGGKVSCSFQDEQQVLVLLPTAARTAPA